MTADYIHMLKKLSERRNGINNKIHAIKRIVEEFNDPMIQFGSAYTNSVSITREQAPDLFNEVYEIVIECLQDELDKLDAKLDKANSMLKECLTDEI